MANCGTITVDGDGGSGGDPGDGTGSGMEGAATLAILAAVGWVAYKQFGGSK